MKKVILISIPALIVLYFWTEISEFFNAVWLFATNPLIWKINPLMIGVWVVWKFHKYLWSDKVDIASGEKIGEYNSLPNAEYHTKKYIQANYDSGYDTQKWEAPDGNGGWKVVEFAITVVHTVCTVIFVPIKRED